VAKVQKVFGNIIGYNGKKYKNSKNTWKLFKDFISLYRQRFAFGYPGKFPERASRIRIFAEVI
jgi:hypothetical protein